QDVSDDVNYLDSIGRKQSAEVQKKALIAEARAKAESATQAAFNKQQTEISKIDAAISTARARNASRMADAETRSGALVAEAEGQVASKLARAEGELEVQKARVEQVRRQLAADVLEPARARKAAAEAAAKGAASQIVEQGRATASAMTQIAGTWREVGRGSTAEVRVGGPRHRRGALGRGGRRAMPDGPEGFLPINLQPRHWRSDALR